MPNSSLDCLLDSLEVHIRAFVTCKLAGERVLVAPTDCVGVYYVTDGDGVLQRQDGRRMELHADCAVLATSGSGPLSIAPLQDQLQLMCCHATASVGGAVGLFDSLGEPLIEVFQDGQLLRETFARIARERAERQAGMEAMSRAMLKQCLILIVREHLARSDAGSWFITGLMDARLARAMVAVLQDPSAAHTVGNLASIAGMSRSAFAKRFLERLQQSPMEFVKKARLRQAAGLLSTTNLPVKAIAARTGYASRSHFSRAFRAAYDVEPSRFRSGTKELARAAVVE